jgi:transposase-like protein
MRGMTSTSETKWRRLIAAQEKSGLPVREFAATRGVSPTTLYWWRSKLRRDRVELVPVEVVGRDVASDQDSTVAPCFELQVNRSTTLRIPPGFDEGELRRLLRVVRC